MQKCSLCGGRVVNGRCEDCGLPIPPEHSYTLPEQPTSPKAPDRKTRTVPVRRYSEKLENPVSYNHLLLLAFS